MTALSAPRTNSIVEFAERTGISYSAASRALSREFAREFIQARNEALCLPMLGAIAFGLGMATAFLL